MNLRLALLLLGPTLSCAAPAPREQPLFDGATLAGWRELGDARWSVDDGCILGEVGGGAQSFLVSERRFGDFVLELELRNELPGNSGVQVRSAVRDDGRLQGYQIEVDPSPRAWSGGLYDEARRGWLDDLADDPAARAAFRPGEWNRYRIECRGAWIRAWVNGVPTADHLDALDLAGHVALQVHSGDDTRMRWRKLRLTDLGESVWRDVPPSQAALQGACGALRFHVPGEAQATRLVDVLWQDGRFAVQVDGKRGATGTYAARSAEEREIPLRALDGARPSRVERLVPASR